MEVRGPQDGDYCSNEYPRPLTAGLCSYNSELQIFSSESCFVNVLNDREFHASLKGQKGNKETGECTTLAAGKLKRKIVNFNGCPEGKMELN